MPPRNDSQKTTERRKKMMRAIHAERRRAGLDDDTYRDMLKANFGVKSSKDLRTGQMSRLLGLFRQWNGPRGEEADLRQAAALRERAREIAAYIHNGEARLQGLCLKICGVPRLDWAHDPEKLERLLAALGKIEREYG